MKIESNLGEVILNLTTKLQNIDGEFTRNALLEASYQTLNKIKHRIQVLGENAAGVMISRANHKIGAYSARYAVQRHKKGLQTLRVDLTATGDLMREFQITHWGAKEVWLGFFDKESNRKADYLEEYFGRIFALNEEEREFCIQVFQEEIIKYIIDRKMNG